MQIINTLITGEARGVDVRLTMAELATIGRGLGKLIFSEESTEKDEAKQLQYKIVAAIAEASR